MFELFARFWLPSFIVVCLISALFGAWLWPYILNTWLVFAGKQATVTWWMGAVLGALPPSGAVMVPVAILTWILMLFLV